MTHRLRIGIHSDLREHGPQAEIYRETLDHFVRAEELGFDSAWVRSYHFRRTSGTPGFSFPGGLPSPFVFLGALAARTSRIRIGTGVVTATRILPPALPRSAPSGWSSASPTVASPRSPRPSG